MLVYNMLIVLTQSRLVTLRFIASKLFPQGKAMLCKSSKIGRVSITVKFSKKKKFIRNL